MINFKKEFLDIDFDDILNNENNPLVNSYDYYIKYKKEYLDESFKRFLKYQKTALELNKLYEIKNIKLSSTKVIYTYINKSRIEKLEKTISELIIAQRRIFSNFVLYVKYLNENQNNIHFDFMQEDIYKHTTVANNKKYSQSVLSKESIGSIESGKRSRGSIRSVSIDLYRQKHKKEKRNIFSKLVFPE